jgi:uncharacterized RDD family membrane protein YckC
MWYYVSGGERLGPVDDAALDELVRRGLVGPDTLVWREGMPAWQPYASVRGPVPAAAPLPPPAAAPPPAYGPPVGSALYPPRSGVYFDYALWPTRVFGALVDYAFVLVAMIVLYLLGFVVFGSLVGLGSGFNVGAVSDFGSTACCCMLLLLPISSLAVGIYNKVYRVSTLGFSIGQGVMKIKVVDAQGNKLSFGQAFVRLLVQAALSLIWIASVLDHLWPLWDERRQTLHDKAVSCYVINNPSGT